MSEAPSVHPRACARAQPDPELQLAPGSVVKLCEIPVDGRFGLVLSPARFACMQSGPNSARSAAQHD